VDRRGFFRRLIGRRDTKLSCLAIQVVIRADADHDLRKRIHQAIDGTHVDTVDAKRRAYKALASLLVEAEPFFEYAFYTYEPDEDNAEAEFRGWVSEIEAGIATEALETGKDVDGYHRLDAEKSYIVVSVLFLITGPHPWDQGGALGYDDGGKKHTFDGADPESYTRKKLAELIDTIALLDFEAVTADASFVVPGSEEDGLSWSDIADEGWAHLVMLRSS
jgi:hypothetical protein